MVECKIQKLEDLAILPNPFDGSNNFKMVIRFADKNLKDRMNGFVEERRKYSIYKEAVSNISDTSIDSNKTAIRLFNSIIDYKDSKDKIEKCEYNLKLIPYNEACKLMNTNSVELNRKAIKIFESLEDFKDSKDKILDCEINLKKIPYNEACNQISETSIDSNQKAIQIFESIIDFEDSRENIEKCNSLINFIKEKEEIKRIEAEKEAERKRIEEERKRKEIIANFKKEYRESIVFKVIFLCFNVIICLVGSFIMSSIMISIDSNLKGGKTFLFFFLFVVMFISNLYAVNSTSHLFDNQEIFNKYKELGVIDENGNIIE